MRFSLGKAKAYVREGAARTFVGIQVESPNVQDFIDLYEAVCTYLEVEHKHLPRPKDRLDDMSFVSGLRNDLQALCRYIASRLRLRGKAAN
jgi:hypothetical protein